MDANLVRCWLTTCADARSRTPQLGDVYLLKFDGIGREQSGVRPGVIISNNKGNRYSPNVIVLPLTTSLKRLKQPTHVVVDAATSGLNRDSMVLCENPVCVSKDRCTRYITTLQPHQLAEVSTAYLLATGALSCLTEEQVINLRKRAVSLDVT